MSRVRVCFLGTPEFAVTCLKAMLNDEHFEVVGVVTQPDRPSGRKLQLTPSPVKSLALSKGLRVISPESLKNNPLIFEEIKKWRAEVAVVVAFGQILTEEFLAAFPFGAVNVHASLLPRWRGAAPIQRAIEAGDSVTGVCLQKMVKKLDAGDVLGERKMNLDERISGIELHDRLAEMGADLLRVELMDYVRGNLVGRPQDENLVTYAKKIDKAESHILWKDLTAEQIHNKVRALQMGPGTYFVLDGKKVKVHLTEVVSNAEELKSLAAQPLAPGAIIAVSDNGILVHAKQGVVRILEVQPESRNRMPVEAFLKGHSLVQGMVLG